MEKSTSRSTNKLVKKKNGIKNHNKKDKKDLSENSLICGQPFRFEVLVELLNCV